MELRFVDRTELAPELGRDVVRTVKRLQYRPMELTGISADTGKPATWSPGPWQDVPFVAPEDE